MRIKINKEKYEDMKVWDPNHKDYQEFLINLDKIKVLKDNRIAISNG